MPKLHRQMFVAQSTLEAWVDSGKVDFRGSEVTLKSFGRIFDLEPAVRFTAVVEGPRESRLLGKVLAESDIPKLGGELLGDSVVFGEIAFQIRPGYIASRRASADSLKAAPPRKAHQES